MSPEFKIKLNIAGRSFSLTIEREREEIYRRAEKEVNQLVSRFKGQYRATDDEYLAMAALQIAVGYVEQEMSRSLGDDIEALAEIDSKLDKYFATLD